ncbi:hypothetical protein [Rhodococcus sp. UFZ-B548]|uniref:hypothetical protein n=1 Tax=Rhodococcus sp. UFZ-B548 TaxID=2742212 RepID=UPI0015F77037|nr:hypothetical protein [Rhodococcus sp. UFZ-B548]
MKIFDILPTTLRDRMRIRLNQSPTTPIANWDTSSPIDLPQPDVEAIRQMIVERVAAHAAAGSLDDAYGDLLDRIINPVCRRWSELTKSAHEEQLKVWKFLEFQGSEHSVRLGQQLARLDIELARHQDAEARVWSSFDGTEQQSAAATEPAARNPLPLPAVPIAQLPHPYRPADISAPEPTPPSAGKHDPESEPRQDEPPTPLIHSA